VGFNSLQINTVDLIDRFLKIT